MTPNMLVPSHLLVLDTRVAAGGNGTEENKAGRTVELASRCASGPECNLVEAGGQYSVDYDVPVNFKRILVTLLLVLSALKVEKSN